MDSRIDEIYSLIVDAEDYARKALINSALGDIERAKITYTKNEKDLLNIVDKLNRIKKTVKKYRDIGPILY